MNETRPQPREVVAREAVRSVDQNPAPAAPYLEAAIPIGLLGAGAVAGFVFILDLVAGQPLATPNALGATIFRGMEFNLATPLAAINVFAYTLMHSALFIVAATAAITAQFTLSRKGVSLESQFLLGVAALFVALQASSLSLMMLLEIPLSNEFGFGRLLAINALAATGMATVVYQRASKKIAAAIN